MKLATFLLNGAAHLGVVIGQRIHRVPDLTMLGLIAAGAPAIERVTQLAATAGERDGHDLRDITLLAPIPRPVKNIFCVGRNYKLHIEEGARARGVEPQFPPVPEFFSKPPTTVIGTRSAVRLPAATQRLDYEVELAIVIGKPGRDIAAEHAAKHIFGFTVLNDITARDLQTAHGQWFKGKALDTSCPMGPWIVTADEFDVEAGHRLWLKVNGEKRQDSSTADMLFNCHRIIESLSKGMTLEAGDVIATGTPSGVGLGFDPQVWLRDGDVVEAGIDGIGSIVNTIVAV